MAWWFEYYVMLSSYGNWFMQRNSIGSLTVYTMISMCLLFDHDCFQDEVYILIINQTSLPKIWFMQNSLWRRFFFLQHHLARSPHNFSKTKKRVECIWTSDNRCEQRRTKRNSTMSRVMTKNIIQYSETISAG